MAIVSSTLLAEAAQTDGRFWVQETHTDQLSVQYVVRYLAAIGTDTAALLAARATQISADITAGEIANNMASVLLLGSLAVAALNYSTAAANFAALRTAYATATQVQAIMIGDFLSSLTNAQLQTAFGMTAGQVTTLRTNKLTPAANAATTIRASVGQ